MPGNRDRGRVAANGGREVLGFQVGDTESEPSWTDFSRDLKTRGITGVRLEISDAHARPIRAIQSAAWQRFRVHFMRNVLARAPKAAAQMVAALIRTIFVPRGKRKLMHAQFGKVATMLRRSHPAAAEVLEEAREICSRVLGSRRSIGSSSSRRTRSNT